jgi:hypothetical protein
MKRLLKFTVLFLTMGMLFFDVPIALAVPPLPSGYFGTVKLNGVNVRAGVQVTARINGIQYALSPYKIYDGDTVYSLDVPGDDLSTLGVIEGGIEGDHIVFYIGDTIADQTGAWHSGTSIQLNLTASLIDHWEIYLPLIFRQLG